MFSVPGHRRTRNGVIIGHLTIERSGAFVRVLLLHAPGTLPQDLHDVLRDAGHQVAAHAAGPGALAEFLSAMSWHPEAVVIDYSEGPAHAGGILNWLANHPRWGTVPVVLHAVPDDAAAEASRMLPREAWVNDAAGVVESLEAFAAARVTARPRVGADSAATPTSVRDGSARHVPPGPLGAGLLLTGYVALSTWFGLTNVQFWNPAMAHIVAGIWMGNLLADLVFTVGTVAAGVVAYRLAVKGRTRQSLAAAFGLNLATYYLAFFTLVSTGAAPFGQMAFTQLWIMVPTAGWVGLTVTTVAPWAFVAISRRRSRAPAGQPDPGAMND